MIIEHAVELLSHAHDLTPSDSDSVKLIYASIIQYAWLQVRETCEMYCKVVKPYIDSLPPERIHWVYNILEKKVKRLFSLTAPCPAQVLCYRRHGQTR